MRSVLAALSIVIAGAATPAFAQASSASATAELDPRSLALAQQIIAIAYPEGRRQAMLSSLSESMMQQMRSATSASIGQLDAGGQAIFDRYIRRVQDVSAQGFGERVAPLFAAFARGYARQFTYDELVQIRAFVGTPAGTRFLQRSSDLLADPDVAEANTTYMRAAFASLQPVMLEMRAELADYLSQQQRRR